ncbi:MAG: hypothetical protein A2Y10_08215 [Planctomycetes bacterium GWF2_41_51]|nr:MAG: hypothetical protein A2Y10_08215 [Planctomycetes bacterium GWF2_41_51]HBG26144.1 hypothetical protein [Phycisphaerales bacterium]
MKSKTKKILILSLSFIAAAILTGYLYADCRGKCGESHTSCHIKKTSQITEQGCCHSSKPLPQKTSQEKCGGKGVCCFNNLPPAATINSQNLNNSFINVLFKNCLTELNSNLPAEISSTGSPLQLYKNTQAVLCVFVI